MIPHLGHWAVWAATEAEAVEEIVPNGIKLLLAIGVFLVPYGLGVLIARGLRLKEYAFKIGLVLFAGTFFMMPFFYEYIYGALERQHYEAKLAGWEAEQKKSKLSEQGLQAIQEKNPKLQIIETPEEAAEVEVPSLTR